MTRPGRTVGRVLALASLVTLVSACAIIQGLFPGDAHWALHPDDEIGPDTIEFTALVTENACAGGQSSVGRVVGPDISYSDEAVTVTFNVRGSGGMNTCPSNPATPVVVRLGEPLGDRVLLDGGTDPPREPTACPNVDFCD